jgi:hypothetical protein
LAQSFSLNAAPWFVTRFKGHKMLKNMDSELAALQQMAVSELHDRYVVLFKETPRSRNRTWLIRKIAWRIQSLSEGGLSERAHKRAVELSVDAEVRVMPPKRHPPFSAANRLAPVSIGKIKADTRLPSPGTSLIREYKGQQIEVRVVSDGFEYAGDRFKSLSAIAKVITGSHCNGFRFFQLGSR